jgi:hypothetical protein
VKVSLSIAVCRGSTKNQSQQSLTVLNARLSSYGCLEQPKEAPLSVFIAENLGASLLDRVRALRDEIHPTQPELLEALQGYIRHASKDASLEAPSWFLDNCVKTGLELQRRKINLSIRRDDNDLVSSPMSCDNPDGYEMDAVVYHSVLSIYHAQNKYAPNWSSVFRYNAVYLRYPVKEDVPVRYIGTPCPPPPRARHSCPHAMPPPLPAVYSCGYDAPPPPPPPQPMMPMSPIPLPTGTSTFLSLIVEQFAKDSQADLITLTLEDLKDLAAHFAKEQGVTVASDYATVRRIFGLDGDDGNSVYYQYPSDQEYLPPPPPMLSSPRSKRYPVPPPLLPIEEVSSLVSCRPRSALKEYQFKLAVPISPRYLTICAPEALLSFGLEN